MELYYTIQGIPCLIRVDSCRYHKGDSSADNPWDYYGGFDIEYTVLDRKGYQADWLRKKMTTDERHEIEQEIIRGYDDE